MLIRYIYHSGFVVETDAFDMVFDYWKDTPDGYVKNVLLKRKTPLYVFASHSHGDHFNAEVSEWAGLRPVTYVFSDDIADEPPKNAKAAFKLSKGSDVSDGALRVKTFGSTDLGVSFYVEAGGKKIFHAGDLNNWHWSDESTREEIDEAEGAFRRELGEIALAVPEVDAAFFPVDSRVGTDFWRGAREFAEAVNVGVFVPMHFTSAVKAVEAARGVRCGRYLELTTGGDCAEV